MLVLKKPVPGSKTMSSATSGQILAANSKRRHAVIGGSQTVGLWINYDAAAAVGTGIYVPAGTAYEIDQDNMWQGAVNGILAAGGDQVIGVMELS